MAAPCQVLLPNVLLGILPVQRVNATLGRGARWPYHHQGPGLSLQAEPRRGPPDSLPGLKGQGSSPFSKENRVSGCSVPLAPGKGKHGPSRPHQPWAPDLQRRRLGLPLAYVLPVPTRAQGRRRRARDCRTIPGAGREPAELGEEPPRPGAEHAAPACSARVHPAQRGGDRAEAVAPGRCLGPGRLHVSPARVMCTGSARFGARTCCVSTK